MATHTSLVVHLAARRGDRLSFGPWTFQVEQSYPEFFGAEVTVPPTTLVHLVGGPSPLLAAIGTVEFLGFHPDQPIQIGLHGEDAQMTGSTITLDAHQLLLMGRGELTAVNVYNLAQVLCNLVVIVGGA